MISIGLLIFASYSLLFLFCFASASNKVSSHAIFALVQCHKEFEYGRGNLRQMNYPPHGQEQMQNFMKPYFAIEGFVHDCMMREDNEHIHGEIAKLYKIQEELFQETGFTEWAEYSKEQIEKHYKNFGEKFEISKQQREMNLSYWRRMLIPTAFLWQNAFLEFVKILFDKVMHKLRGIKMQFSKFFPKNVESHVENYEWMLKRLKDEVQNELAMFKYSKMKDLYLNVILFPKYGFEGYIRIFNALSLKLSEVEIDWKMPDLAKLNFTLPKPKRVIWILRHSERQDDLPGRIRNEPSNVFKARGNRTLQTDNPPLSEQGKNNLAAFKNVFGTIPINHVLVCPYERNVETAQQLLDKLGNHHAGLSIKVEPGLLKRCGENPSYHTCEVMKEAHERVDCDYKPVDYRRCSKAEDAAEEEDAMLPRFSKVMNTIFDGTHPSEQLKTKHDQSKLVAELKAGTVKSEWLAPGEEDAEHILIVSHGTVVIGIQQLCDGKNGYLAQISITKFVELDDDHQPGQSSHQSGHHSSQHQQSKGTTTTFIDRLHLIYGSETKHLYTEKSTVDEMRSVMKW